MKRGRETRLEAIMRHRLLITVLGAPAALILLVCLLMPRTSPLEPGYGGAQGWRNAGAASRYSLVVDAGSTGSRIHIFKFNYGRGGELELEFDKFEQLKPGLSAHADDPAAAAASLKPLLALALETIPKAAQAQTHILVGATAGLRLLPGDSADRILDEVRALLAGYPFQFGQNDVRILTGADEGAFAWLTLNYLLGRLGGAEESTVAAIDLGGGSVQEAFALTAAEAGAAPAANYTMVLSGGGRAYNVYVHSYLGYGLMAGRAGVLAAHEPALPHPCVPAGYQGDYVYAGKTHGMKGGDTVDAQACNKLVSKSMNLGAGCSAPQLQCTFNGAWAGDRVPAVFYISSYFWDRAVDAGLVGERDAIQAVVRPAQFQKLAQSVCAAPLADLAKQFPRVTEDARPFFCMDLVFVHTLLLEGFRVPADAELTIVKKVQYREEQIEAAWPLGAAINSLG